MMLTAGLLAAVLGAEAPAHAPQARPLADSPMIATEVRLLEMTGLDWRTTSQPPLDLVTTQGGVSVWTASGKTAQQLIHKAGNLIQAPKVTTFQDAPAWIKTDTRRTFVARVVQVSTTTNGPAGATVPQPHPGTVHEGFQSEIRGRALDQGVLLRVKLEDQWVLKLHQVKTDDGCDQGGCCGASSQVPEVASASILGEWLIPKEGALVIGLGAHTIVDQDGKPAVKEHVAVIQARAVSAPPAAETRAAMAEPRPIKPVGIRLDAGLGKVIFSEPFPADQIRSAAPSLALPPVEALQNLPVLPSRTLPHGTTADGRHVNPPLPDDAIATTASDGNSTEDPHPSPQKHSIKEVGASLAQSIQVQGQVVLRAPDATLNADALRLVTHFGPGDPPTAPLALSLGTVQLGPAVCELTLRIGSPNTLTGTIRFTAQKNANGVRDPEVRPTSATGPASHSPAKSHDCCSASGPKAECPLKSK